MKFQILILSLFFATFGVGSQAQMGPGSGKGISHYDPKSEVSMSGTVDRITQQSGQHGSQCTHLFVKTDVGVIEVHAGPADYLSSQQFSFATGDAIEVTGSNIKMQDKDVLLAREIKKDGKTLVLRNARGLPNWSRGGRT